jgi:hypothetical protein
MMVSKQAPSTCEDMMEKLTDPKEDNIFVCWSRPFFELVKQGKIEKDVQCERTDRLIQEYARMYGIPGWEVVWEVLLETV